MIFVFRFRIDGRFQISDDVLIHAVIYLMSWDKRMSLVGKAGLSWDNVYDMLVVAVSVAEKHHEDGGGDIKHNRKWADFRLYEDVEKFHEIERNFLVQMDFTFYVSRKIVCQIIHYFLHSSEIRFDNSLFLIIVLFYSSMNGVAICTAFNRDCDWMVASSVYLCLL